jgi:hypothetical protein
LATADRQVCARTSARGPKRYLIQPQSHDGPRTSDLPSGSWTSGQQPQAFGHALFLTAGSEDVFQNAHGVELRAALPNGKKRSYLNSE